MNPYEPPKKQAFQEQDRARSVPAEVGTVSAIITGLSLFLLPAISSGKDADPDMQIVKLISHFPKTTIVRLAVSIVVGVLMAFCIWGIRAVLKYVRWS
jgi:hypothetical protein